jgi:hypothetical protein
MTRELTMLIYPWDVQADGAERVLDELAALGVDRLQIATAYHSAEVIAPRRRAGVFTAAEANTVHLPLPGGAFSGLSIPPSSIAERDPELYPRLSAAAAERGIELDGWAIGLHNSTLAVSRPDAALLNCFGDRFTHALCPAHPAVRRYATELFAAVAGTGYFRRILAESISYLLYSHGHPHELWGARLDVTTRYLMSLCFCVACSTAGTSAGIDVQALRAKVARELDRTWNAGFSAPRRPDDGIELMSLLMAWPDLAAFAAMRCERVTSLVTEIRGACAAAGVPLDVSAAVWARPSAANWMEGTDIAATRRVADGFVLESYYDDVADVVRELDHVLALSGPSDAPLTVALTLWEAHHGTAEGLAAKARAAGEAGATGLALYNYSTATRRTLGWVAGAAAEFRATADSKTTADSTGGER